MKNLESAVIASSCQLIWAYESDNNNSCEFGYIVTIPYWAQEKKSIQNIIDLFLREAFSCQNEFFKNRIAFIIGVNQKASEGDVNVAALPNNAHFPFDVSVISFLWDYKDKVPMGDICNFINKSDISTNRIKKMRLAGCQHIYYAKLDADTVAFNQCFSMYNTQIKIHQQQYGALPHIVTSGYVTNCTPGVSGASLDLGSSIDYHCRIAQARHLPFVPYITEANALIYLPNGDAFLQENYSQHCEMAGMREEIIKKRNLNPYQDILFVYENPIFTEYRPGLLKQLTFDGEFQERFYLGWTPTDIKKLRQIWQTHYREDLKFYENIRSGLLAVFPNINNDRAYHKISFAIRFILQNIDRCFDPLAIVDEKLKGLDLTKKIHGDITYVATVAEVLKDYSQYVGWRKPNEEGPSLRLDPGSQGRCFYLENIPKDNWLKDMGNFIYLQLLKEKLSWLVFLYMLNSISYSKHEENRMYFFELVEREAGLYLEYMYHQNPDQAREELSRYSSYRNENGKIFITEEKPLLFKKVLSKLKNIYGEIFVHETESKINKFVDRVVASAHEKGLAVRNVFIEKLSLEYTEHISFCIKRLTIQKIGISRTKQSQENNDWTPIQKSILSSKKDTIQILQLNDLTEIGCYGCNGLHLLAVSDFSNSLSAALDKIRSLEESKKSEIIEHQMDAGFTPLELAFLFGKEKQVAMLIDFGADFKSRKNLLFERTIYCESLAHIISKYGNARSVNLVLNFVGIRDTEVKNPRNLKNYCGETPLNSYVDRNDEGDVEGFNQLVTSENCDDENDDCMTPLENIFWWKNKREIKIELIKRRVRVDGGETGHTPIEFASEDNDVELVGLMLESCPPIRDSVAQTVFADTCSDGSIEILNLLLKYFEKTNQLRIVINHADAFGNTPLDRVILFKKNDRIRLLRNYGADTELLNPRTIGYMLKATKAANELRAVELPQKKAIKVNEIKSQHFSTFFQKPHNYFACTKHKPTFK